MDNLVIKCHLSFPGEVYVCCVGYTMMFVGFVHVLICTKLRSMQLKKDSLVFNGCHMVDINVGACPESGHLLESIVQLSPLMITYLTLLNRSLES